MKIVRLADAPSFDPDRVIARPFLDGRQSNVRIIRLSPGQALPPHRHGATGLTLLAFLAPNFPPGESPTQNS